MGVRGENWSGRWGEASEEEGPPGKEAAVTGGRQGAIRAPWTRWADWGLTSRGEKGTAEGRARQGAQSQGSQSGKGCRGGSRAEEHKQGPRV